MKASKKITWRQVVLSGVLAVTLKASVWPQAVNSPCEPSPEVKLALQKLSFDDDARTGREQRRERGLAILRPLLRQFPDDPFVHRRYLGFIEQVMDDELDSLIAEYKARLERQPHDPLALYLYGNSLIGRQTDHAIALLEKAIERAPDFPLAHLALARIHLQGPWKDLQKARAHLEMFMRLCPSSVEAYELVGRMDDREFLAEAAKKLRAQLQSRTDPEDLSYYRILWRLEFQAKPVAEHPQLRKQIEEDLARLRDLGLGNTLRGLLTLRTGYEMTGDAQGLRWVEEEMLRRFPHSSGVMSLIVYGRWDAAHPRPSETDPPEKRRAYYRALFRATEEWIQRWPDHPAPWLRRLEAASELDDLASAEIETIGERLLSASEKQSDLFYALPPPALQVAQLYLKRGVRLERIPELIERGFREIERRTERDIRRDDLSAEVKKALQGNVDYSYWRGWPILLDAYLKMNRREKAREVLIQMEDFLVRRRPQESAPSEEKRLHARRQAIYWEWIARLAEAENRKLDALAFYQKALLEGPEPDEKGASREDLTKRVERLWRELGGTTEGWHAWLARATAPIGEASPGAWEERQMPLPDFELQDLRGRIWRLADLRGKITFINIWATWCGPCREELPYVQKLYERLKDHPDVLVLTFNVDVDVGLVEPYVNKHGFSFPVIPAYSYVESVLPLVSIPRNWLVGQEGTVVLEQVGFGGQGEKWLAATLEAIERARRPR